MKHYIIFMFFSIIGAIAFGASTACEERSQKEVHEESRREHKCLTKILRLDGVFSYDDKKVIELLRKRFPPGTPIDSVKAELLQMKSCDDEVKISVGTKPDRVWLDVRFIPEKIEDGETKYTFTFLTDARKTLAESYFIKAHYQGSLSAPVK